MLGWVEESKSYAEAKAGFGGWVFWLMEARMAVRRRSAAVSMGSGGGADAMVDIDS